MKNLKTAVNVVGLLVVLFFLGGGFNVFYYPISNLAMSGMTVNDVSLGLNFVSAYRVSNYLFLF